MQDASFQAAEPVLQKLGLTAFVWALLQVFVGAGSVWFDGILFGGGMKARSMWKYHRYVLPLSFGFQRRIQY